MITNNPAWSCQNVKQYYYDFIIDTTRANMPEAAVSHITECVTCQSNLDQLRECLREPRSSAQENHITTISQALELHFSCINVPVTCTMVKPFLPCLADPAIQIRVATPITVHVDHCESCSRDFLTIKSLNLSHVQLCHLGQLLAERQHIKCNVQHPDEKINNIIERSDSGVATVFTINESQNTEQQSDGRYGNHPVKVQVLSFIPSEQQRLPESIKQSAQNEAKVFKLNYRTFIKPVTAAAAIFLIALLLWFTTPHVVASDISEIYNMLAKAKNIHIQVFFPDKTVPVQEHWVSADLDIKFSKTNSGLEVLRDFSNGTMKIRDISGITTHPMSSDLQDEPGIALYYKLGLLPFQSVADAPPGAKWQAFPRDANSAQGTNETCELTWQQSKNEVVHTRIWRVFVIDNKPVKIERYLELGSDGQRRLESTIIIDYPTLESMKMVLHNSGL